MDIKKFITNTNFHDINNLIQLEHSNQTNESLVLHNAFDLDFFTIKNINKDDEIIEFEKTLKIDIKTKLAYHGPQIKKYFDPDYNNEKTQNIKNIYYVSIIDTNALNIKNVIDIEKFEYKSGHYIIQLNKTLFYVSKIIYNSKLALLLQQSDFLNRVIFFDDKLYVTNKFIIDCYSKYVKYNKTNVDPVFGGVEDILNIYDKQKINSNIITLQHIIDIIDLDQLYTYNKKNIEIEFISIDNNQYTPIEYVLYKLINNVYCKTVINQYTSMIIYLLTINFIRPVCFYAKLINFDKKYPGIYMMIEKNTGIQYLDIINSTTFKNINHINLTMIKKIISIDNDIFFIEYLKYTNLYNKLYKECHTSSLIIDWVIDYNANKIILSIFKIIPLIYKYKIAYLTQNLKLFGDEYSKYFMSDSSLILPTNEQDILINLLPNIINNGLCRSLYACVKIIPNFFDLNKNILHYVISDNAHLVVELLLKLNIDIIDQKNNDGKTPLISYSELGFEKCINVLLNFNSDYELSDNLNESCLHKLAKNGHFNILQNMSKKIINIIDSVNNLNQTPIMLAAINKHENIVILLKSFSANCSIVDIYGNSIYHYICLSSICIGSTIINKTNYYGFTPYDYCPISKSYYKFI